MTGNPVEITFLPPAIRRVGEGNSFSLFTFRRGGPQSQIFGGVPSLRFLGGVPSLRFLGGPRFQIFRGGPGLRFFGGSQSQIFWGGYPVSVKGKIFDTRFGLIHVQTGKIFFFEGPPQ